jgi:serine/threonine protein kinase
VEIRIKRGENVSFPFALFEFPKKNKYNLFISLCNFFILQMAYIISKKINHGDYACIYQMESHPNHLAKVEMIKRNSSTKKEAEIHSELSHPNIVRLLDALQTDTLIRIAPSQSPMPLYQILIMEKHGTALTKTKDYTIEKLKLYAFQIADGLLYLKHKNIIHRDIKPPNLLLQDDHVKICDFGLSCVGPYRNPKESVGTPYYMALESFKGVYTFSTDIFAFGVTLYELYTKNMPFPSSNLRGLLDLIEFGYVPFPEGFDNANLQDLILKMLKNEGRISIEGVKEHVFFK